MVHSEVAHTDDDFMQQVFRWMLGTVPQQGADDVPESQRKAFGS